MRKANNDFATIVAFCSGAVVLAVVIGLAIDVVPAWAITGIAVLWSVGSVVGIIDTLATLNEVLQERNRTQGDPILLEIATANVRRECFRLLELLAILVIGLVAIGGTGGNPVLARLLILYVVILLISNARLDRLERQSTDHLIREAREITVREGHSDPRANDLDNSVHESHLD